MTPPPNRHPRNSLGARLGVHLTLLLLIARLGISPAIAEAGQDAAAGAPRTLAIPYLASATNPSDLDFAAAECDLSPNGRRMECRFRQIFLTTSSIDRAACVITTNGFTRQFRRESPVVWLSEAAPVGTCGLVETTTLADGGGARWTMTLRTRATQNLDQQACRNTPEAVEVHDWRNVKRKLPCTSVQPGAIER